MKRLNSIISGLLYSFILFFIGIHLLTSCKQESARLSFKPFPVATEANLWWARVPADINQDGILDIVLQDNNGYGGWLGWLEGNISGDIWTTHVIAEKGPGGNTFACGDMDAGDIDLDGDIDILGFEHPGEWDSAGAATRIYWYNNPEWVPTYIGSAPDFIKDLNLTDLNGDHKPDLATITYEENKLVIYRQDSPEEWVKVLDTAILNLHEGMDVGDIDGDGDIDIAPNGYWIENPGGEMTENWIIHTIDPKWNNQDGDWSKNGTKICCRDITGDGRAEIFITHSERQGYSLSWYQSDNPASGEWTENIIYEDLPAAHTLQVFDFDLDGQPDILSGINKNRARALEVETFPVFIFLNKAGTITDTILLSEEGIYNGQCGDLEGDGDIDIFRYPTHNDSIFEVLVNMIR
jgi:hypothetical protein